MSDLEPSSGRPPAPAPLPPTTGLLRLTFTLVHVTVFFALLNLGYAAGTALALTTALGLSAAKLLRELVGETAGPQDGAR